MGENNNGCLGLGHKNPVESLEIMQKLSQKSQTVFKWFWMFLDMFLQ